MNRVEWALVIWSGAALLWWLTAGWLVGRRQPAPSPLPGRVQSPPLTIFKPLPEAASPVERTALADAVTSFITQLDAADELLIGVAVDEVAHWQPFFDEWRTTERGRRVRVCSHPPPQQRANPKIAWLEVLAPQARGELWLWSDADIVAPPGWLAELKNALQTSSARAVSCPFCVRQARSPAAVLDTAFVNAELLPGALLLRRRDSVSFAFGAATLFRAADFRARATWDELGASLADDYALGQSLKPVALTGPMVETLALETTATGSLQHYYRWQKTIRWCRPGSYAALLAILPLLGWAVFAALQPANPVAWLGVGGQWGIEVAAVATLCLSLQCRLSAGAWIALTLWPPIRALTWLAVWLPLAVTWRGTRSRWSRPTAEPGAAGER